MADKLKNEREAACKIIDILNESRMQPVNCVASCGMVIAAITAQHHEGDHKNLLHTLDTLKICILDEITTQREKIKRNAH